jgi:prophage antirepressor-like protein
MVLIRSCCYRRERLFDLRRKAHQVFDQFWCSKVITRRQAYRWLAAMMNLRRCDCHVRFFNSRQCYQVIELCRRSSISDVSNWVASHRILYSVGSDDR